MDFCGRKIYSLRSGFDDRKVLGIYVGDEREPEQSDQVRY